MSDARARLGRHDRRRAPARRDRRLEQVAPVASACSRSSSRSTRHVSVPDDPARSKRCCARPRRARAWCWSRAGSVRRATTSPPRSRRAPSAASSCATRAALESIRAFFRRFNREMAENNAKQADFPEGAEVLAEPDRHRARLHARGPVRRPGRAARAALLHARRAARALPHDRRGDRAAHRRAARPRAAWCARGCCARSASASRTSTACSRDLAQGDADTVIGFRTQFPDNLVRILARAPDDARRAGAARRARARDARAARRPGRRRGRAEARGGRRRAAARAEAHHRRRRVAHRRAHREPADRRAGQLRVSARRRRRLRERRQGARARRRARSRSRSTARSRSRWRARWPRACAARRGADIGLATTGVAGPDGGSAEKPVGTLWLALADGAGTIAHRYQLMTDRARNKELASQLALDWIRRRAARPADQRRDLPAPGHARARRAP